MMSRDCILQRWNRDCVFQLFTWPFMRKDWTSEHSASTRQLILVERWISTGVQSSNFILNKWWWSYWNLFSSFYSTSIRSSRVHYSGHWVPLLPLPEQVGTWFVNLEPSVVCPSIPENRVDMPYPIPWIYFFFFKQIVQVSYFSQNHGMVEVERDLWKSSCPIHLFEQGQPEHIAQDMSRWLVNISKNGDSTTSLVPVLCHLHFSGRNM